MTDYVISLGMGYLIGCINPAAILSKIKKVDLKKLGTKNLGATNTGLVLGRKAGLFVMFFDIIKSFFSSKLACLLYPQIGYIGLIAGIGCILGHCFPIFMNFKGGKGTAAFGGMVLAYNPLHFVILLIPGVILMLILNTGIIVPVLACVLFPVLVMLHSKSLMAAGTAAISGAIVLFMNRGNVKAARSGSQVVLATDYLKNILFKRNKK
ncbi:MAG: glycerol-3-phosphate acyltransferase [Clostridiales bacterium]|nr:glycerol-3-phosphate acyltransferase [Clostridiales bacterium]